MAENANFSTEENDECLPNFVIFGENELLEVSDKLDDDEISLFVEENRNLYATELTSIFQCLKWSSLSIEMIVTPWIVT